MPTDDIVGGLRNKSSVTGTPFGILLEYFFYHLISIAAFFKDLVQGISNSLSQIAEQFQGEWWILGES